MAQPVLGALTQPRSPRARVTCRRPAARARLLARSACRRPAGRRGRPSCGAPLPAPPRRAALALLAAAPVCAQYPAQVQPLPFTPAVPPVGCSGRVGRDYINCAIPDNRVLAGASFFNTDFERVYNQLYGPRRIVLVADVPL